MSNQRNSGTFDFLAYEDDIDRLIQRNFRDSQLSNAKWRKCFEFLDERFPELQVIWKFVDSKNDGVRYGLPALASLEETYLNNRFWFGPRYYKEIEWLEFPHIGIPDQHTDLPIVRYEQDINALAIGLEELGQWPIEASELGLKLYGHK